MHAASLRKVGGSVMLPVPPAFLNQLELRAGSSVGISVQLGQIIVDPKPKPRYSLTELLAQSDYTQAQTSTEREWVDARPVGGELI